MKKILFVLVLLGVFLIVMVDLWIYGGVLVG